MVKVRQRPVQVEPLVDFGEKFLNVFRFNEQDRFLCESRGNIVPRIQSLALERGNILSFTHRGHSLFQNFWLEKKELEASLNPSGCSSLYLWWIRLTAMMGQNSTPGSVICPTGTDVLTMALTCRGDSTSLRRSKLLLSESSRSSFVALHLV